MRQRYIARLALPLVVVIVVAVFLVRAAVPALHLGRQGAATGLAFSPDGRTLFAATGAGLRRWTYPELRELPPVAPGPFAQVTLSPDGLWLVAATQTNPVELRVWELPSEQLRATSLLPLGVPQAFAWQPGGDWLALAFPGYVEVWRLADGAASRETAMRAENGPVGAVAFSRDGRELVAPTRDGLKRWAVEGWQEIAPPLGLESYRPDSFASVAVSPDGILAGGQSRWATIRLDRLNIALWPRAGEASMTLSGHRDEVVLLAFSPDGRYLASAAGVSQSGLGPRENTVRLWRAADGRQIRIVRGRDRAFPFTAMPIARALCFSPDGKMLVVGQDDGTVKFHDIP